MLSSEAIQSGIASSRMRDDLFRQGIAFMVGGSAVRLLSIGLDPRIQESGNNNVISAFVLKPVSSHDKSAPSEGLYMSIDRLVLARWMEKIGALQHHCSYLCYWGPHRIRARYLQHHHHKSIGLRPGR